MVEIYNYDITQHERFADDRKNTEAFYKQYHIPLSRSGLIAVQTRILNFIPTHPALALLMQTYLRKMWARFTIPKNYYTQRFSSSYVAPSLGTFEKQEADIHKVRAFVKNQTRGRFIQRRQEHEHKQDQNEPAFEESEKENGLREDKRIRSRDEQLLDEGEAIALMMEKGVIETNQMVDYVISRMHQFIQA